MREMWCQVLCYLIPYILIWCNSDEPSLNEQMLAVITQYLESKEVTLDFLTRIMETFIKQR